MIDAEVPNTGILNMGDAGDQVGLFGCDRFGQSRQDLGGRLGAEVHNHRAVKIGEEILSDLLDILEGRLYEIDYCYSVKLLSGFCDA